MLIIILQRDEDYKHEVLSQHDWFLKPIPELRPTYGEVALAYAKKGMAIGDPTALILVDEADRLWMAGLKQVRSISDAGNIGMILIAVCSMPPPNASRRYQVNLGSSGQPQDRGVRARFVLWDSTSRPMGIYGDDIEGGRSAIMAAGLPV